MFWGKYLLLIPIKGYRRKRIFSCKLFSVASQQLVHEECVRDQLGDTYRIRRTNPKLERYYRW